MPAGLLLLKAALTASVVVAASLVAERSRPLVSAVIPSLPISAGPAYALLALDHDAAFLAQASLVGLPVNLSTIALVLAYGRFARRRRGVLVSLGAGYAAWLAATLAIRSVDWTIPRLFVALAPAFALAIPATRHWRAVAMPRVVRRWWDVPARAAVVGALTMAVVGLSAVIGPAYTGILAGLPVAFSSFILIMHPRVGGSPTAGLMANGLVMLIGFALGLLAFHLAAAAGRVTLGLGLFALVPVAYSVGVLGATGAFSRR